MKGFGKKNFMKQSKIQKDTYSMTEMLFEEFNYF